MKAINAIPESIGWLFRQYNFIIPHYQRPYSWSVEQCDVLWDDISSFFEGKKEGSEKYFLGSMVVHPLNEDGQDTWCVIDGQQRITTLMILIKVLYENARSEKWIDSRLYQVDKRSDEAQIGNLRLVSRVQASSGQGDLHDLRRVMGHEESFTTKNSPFKKNYEHLQEKVREWLSGKSANQFEAFISAFRDRVVLLPLVCSEEDDALEIFQIVNDRGMQLRDADIFKAEMYRAVAEEDKESFIARWEALGDPGSGVHDSLFRAFMHISRADANEVSTEIALRKYVKPKLQKEWKSILRCLEVCRWVESVGDVCSDETMRTDANIYWQILACHTNVYWQYPLFVFVHKHKKDENGKFSLPLSAQQEYITLLKNTVRYFYIKGVVYNTVNAVKYTVYKACVAIVNGRDCATVYQNDIDERHDKRRFAENLEDGEFGRFEKGLILINSLPSDQQERTAYADVLLGKGKYGKCEIEHILPKEWNHYDKWNSQSHVDEYVEKLGNKIPLEKKLNIKASNEFFQRKQKEYAKSDIAEARELAEKDPAQWYPEDVDARQKKSLERLRKFFNIAE